MGLSESKPSEVSDEAWLTYQRERFQHQKELQKSEVERQELEDERRKKLEDEKREMTRRMVVHFGEYTNSCHDVPGWMMVFPERRKQCHLARTAFLNDAAFLAFNDEETRNNVRRMSKNFK